MKQKENEVQWIKNLARKFQRALFGKQKKSEFNEHYTKHEDMYEASIWLSGIGGFFSIAYIYEIIKRKKNIQRYEGRQSDIRCLKSEDECTAILDKFKQGEWMMNIQFRDSGRSSIICTVKNISLKKVDLYRYDIKMSAKDEIGASTLEGRLMFTG